MTIAIVTPAPPGSRKGNRVTAERWARLLRELGHRVRVIEAWDGGDDEILIALHAGRSAPSIEHYHRDRPRGPLVVALTGTDVYGPIATDPQMLASVRAADRLIVLQPRAIDRLPPPERDKARVIYQSCVAPQVDRLPSGTLEVCVLAHLRAVKDPMLTAAAVAQLAPEIELRVTHAGAALDRAYADRAETMTGKSRRYHWVGELSGERALDLLARSHLMVLTSRAEGGANVITEAIACQTPILTTRIEGSIGLLGADYPGYFAPGDHGELAVLLERAATCPDYLDTLRACLSELAPLVAPAEERRRLGSLVAELAEDG
jgi:putative glycosyltransferase (TIGR04348 family)